MNAPRTIPNNATNDTITYDIISGGNAIDPGIQLTYLAIIKEVNRIPTAELVFRDGEVSEQNFDLSNSEDFIPGNEIQIKVGRDRDNETVFTGIIIKHSISIEENGNSSLRVECKDASIKMTIGRHSRYFEERKDSEVMEELIGEYGDLESDVEVTQLTHKELIQHHTTDWDFVLSRADVNGKLVIIDDGTVQVKAPDTSQEPTISLTYGGDILAYEAEIDARTQWKAVGAQAWDYANQSLFDTEENTASFTEHGNITGDSLADAIGLRKFELKHSGHVLEEELSEWAKACMLKSRLAKIRGRAKVITGQSSVKPGQVLELRGVGNRFNGNAYITAVRHEVSAGKWDTHIQFGLSPNWFACAAEIMDYPAAGLLPGIKGLQIGKVVELENDPDGEDRILVKLPIIDNDANGIWARIASLDAGEERGAFFRPELDDEVIVGFINDDPRDAVVLGMLHSSAKPAPITAANDNHEKGFTTRSKMHILFNDDTKTITIDTPAGNSIIIDEDTKSIEIKDQNDNKVLLSPDGIELDSPKEIKITAGTNITISASAQLTVEAAQIGLTASGPFSAEGATSSLSASGITELTGSLVKIN